VTTPHDDLQLRSATATDYDGIATMLGRAFADDYRPDSPDPDQIVFEPERNLIFTEGGRVVANAGVYTRDLTIPGSVVPAAHVTLVGVHPTYRRRGLLTRMMHRQLREVREDGRESLAVVWASEGRIYPRFGYGLATQRLYLESDRRDVALVPRLAAGGGRLREMEVTDARKTLIEVYEQARTGRVGWSSRDERWWDHVLMDPKDQRDGATARRALLYDGPDGVEGYALWRTRPDWTLTGPHGRTDVRELVATTPAAYAAMWRFLLSVDLTRTLRYWYASLDEPLLYLVDEPRALGARLLDALYVRLVDLPAALAARRYATAVDVVIEVTHALLPENSGRWRLTAPSGAPARCTAAPDATPDLACDVSDLGAVYLGGPTLLSLAAAGRVGERRAGAVAEASLAFGWERQPSATEVF
jgi:predicted acetyltransferase